MELWTGIACLIPDPNCKEFNRFGDAGQGAYVNIVAWAFSEEEFVNRVKQATSELDCILLELEDIQLLDGGIDKPDYPEELIAMRETAQRQRDDIVFGCFHIWTQDDAN